MHKIGGTALGTLYENIIALCNERGIKGGKMCTDIGMSKGILTDLKMGRQTGISAANAQKIASYFDVSVGYLLGDEDKKENPTAHTSSEVDEVTMELMDIIQNGTDEDRQDLLEMYKMLKRREQR
jgi:transcriptional regulator with XRE-family HTH domain